MRGLNWAAWIIATIGFLVVIGGTIAGTIAAVDGGANTTALWVSVGMNWAGVGLLLIAGIIECVALSRARRAAGIGQNVQTYFYPNGPNYARTQ